MSELQHTSQVVDAGGVAPAACVVRNVEEFVRRVEPGLLAPRFTLGRGESLNAVGLHHNFQVFASRYAKLLATAPQQEHADHAGDTYVIGGSDNFYHFVTNYLARVYYYRDADPARSRFVVSDAMPAHYYEFFPPLGIDPAKLKKVPAQEYNLFPRAIIANLPHYMHGGLRGDARAFRWLRERLARKAPAGRHRLLLSRSRAAHRRLVNEDELLQIAAKQGFAKIFPEDYSVPQLLEMLSATEVLISPYGAGATNSLFCPEDCVIVDLVGRHALGKLNTPTLCALAGQRCIRIVGTELNPEIGWQYRDLQFAPRDFELGLRTAVGMI